MQAQEICKDLAYSYEQLQEFLGQMQGVSPIDTSTYNYKSVRICLKAQDITSSHIQNRWQGTLRPLPRCYMFLRGDADDIQEFYTTFMLHHMTMGG